MLIWLAAVAVILTVAALSVLGLLLTRRVIPMRFSEGHNDVAGFLFATLGVIYAVVLAFVVFTVWDRYNNVTETVTREAADVVMVYRDTQSFPPPLNTEAQTALDNYMDAVMSKEWVVHGELTVHDEPDALNPVWDAYRKVEPTTPLAVQDMADASARLHELELDRHLRHLSTESTLPTIYWLLLIGGGIITIAFTYFFHLDNMRDQAAMTACLAALIAASLFVIFVMNDPFTGPVSVSQYPFEHAIRHVRELNLGQPAAGP